eukprot:TRINITY_DN1487_c0_g1_i6.p2 TRINITY_DN1487_c0_g1~~TRINITY_DN1487_c0_g1_i6.p2  ORF type:complete len:115 (-),score=9.14 TRINITY_DN1487_c0_g1_i6:628-972(-)
MCIRDRSALRPMFDGAAWAGSMIWGCSLVLASHLYQHHANTMPNKRVLELGYWRPGMPKGLMLLGCCWQRGVPCSARDCGVPTRRPVHSHRAEPDCVVVGVERSQRSRKLWAGN